MDGLRLWALILLRTNDALQSWGLWLLIAPGAQRLFSVCPLWPERAEQLSLGTRSVWMEGSAGRGLWSRNEAQPPLQGVTNAERSSGGGLRCAFWLPPRPSCCCPRHGAAAVLGTAPTHAHDTPDSPLAEMSPWKSLHPDASGAAFRAFQSLSPLSDLWEGSCRCTTSTAAPAAQEAAAGGGTGEGRADTPVLLHPHSPRGTGHAGAWQHNTASERGDGPCCVRTAPTVPFRAGCLIERPRD